jgi:phage shock protein A
MEQSPQKDRSLDTPGPDAAKEYLLECITALKLTEKHIAELEAELNKWDSRIELAKLKGQNDLALEAEHERELIKGKRERLAADAEELKSRIDAMRRQLPLLAARERSIDPDLLEQELLMAAGRLPGDEKKAQSERLLREMEKDAAASEALAALKTKMENNKQ